MTVTWREILFFLILFGANLIQAITGFAGTLLAMPPSMQLLGVDEAKSVLAVLDQLSCLLIVLTGFRHINWKEFGKMAVLMVVGMFAGMKIFEAFPIQQLLTLYGVMILCIALWKLFGQRLMKKSGLSRVRGAEAPQTEENQQTNPQTAETGQADGLPASAVSVSVKKKGFPLRTAGMLCVILAAGVIHGMFVSGGALLVVYASSVIKDKNQFRATVAPVWVILNLFLMISDESHGYMTPDVLALTGLGMIPLFLAIYIGNKIQKKINQAVFLKITYILLVVSGISVLVS